MASTVSEVMTRNPETVEADQPVVEAARRMRDADIGDVVVLDNGRVVGILSLGDLAIEQDETSALADISAAAPND